MSMLTPLTFSIARRNGRRSPAIAPRRRSTPSLDAMLAAVEMTEARK
jgi:hypothetical protein